MTREQFLKLCAAGAIGTLASPAQGAERVRPDQSTAQPTTFPTGVTAAVVAFIQQSRFEQGLLQKDCPLPFDFLKSRMRSRNLQMLF